MSPRNRARFGLLAVLLLLPLASAQLPPVAPPVETPSGVLDVQEGPLTLRGPAHSPTHLLVRAEDGTTLVEYTLDAEGRARLDVAGENAVGDATFVRMEGDPTTEPFTLVLRDAQGGEHALRIDAEALAAAAALPDLDLPDAELPEAPVAIERPVGWPGAPQRSYLVNVRDSAGNQLAAAQLGGDAFLQKGGTHRATLQIPHADDQWDRWMVSARREGDGTPLNASFSMSHATDDALVLFATFTPGLLDPADGGRIALEVIHEKRLSPLVVQRFAEPAAYRYRVDGIAPTMALQSPQEANDFRFPVSWTSADATSGVGAHVLYYRESGTSSWTHWLTTSESSATFSGEWGRTYELRARSLDRVGNPSADAFAATRIVAQPSGEDDINDPPTVRLLTPRAGSELSGVVTISWLASDPDGTAIASRVEISDDEGETYRLLYAGSELSTTWDTRGDADGSGYKIRLTASDGTQKVSDSASALKVRNVVAPPPPAAPAGQDPAVPAAPSTGAPSAPQPAAPAADEPVEPAADDGEEGSRGVPAPFAGIALLVALVLAGRRRRL